MEGGLLDAPVAAATTAPVAPATHAAEEENAVDDALWADGDGEGDEADEPTPHQRRALQEAEDERARARNHDVAASLSSKVALKDSRTAQRRLMRDLHNLQQTLASAAGQSMGLSAHPIGGDIFHWRAVIAGPEDSPWEGGLFKLDLQFDDRYPLVPPTVRFLTKGVFHPNVYVDGNICLDTLKSCWSPTLDVEALLLSITSLLSDPNPRSAANGEAARMLVENRSLYLERVRAVAEKSLEQSFSDMEGDDEEDG